MKQFLMAGVCLLAAPVWAQLPAGMRPTVFSRIGSTLKVTGGHLDIVGGNTIYAFPAAEFEFINGVKVWHKLMYFAELSCGGDDDQIPLCNVAGPGCHFTTEFQHGNYVECPMDGVRSIRISLGTNPRNNFAYFPSPDPVTGQNFQYPDVTSMQLKSSSDENDFGLALTAPNASAIFTWPSLTTVEIKTKHEFGMRY